MRIVFATVAPLVQGPAGPTSELASARYRALIPARGLARLGHEVSVASPLAVTPRRLLEPAPDALVISKSFHPENEALAAAARAAGMRVVVDFCDDYFDDARYGAHFRALAGLAHRLVASSQGMADSVARHVGREAWVIPDPVEGPRGAPAFRPGAVLRVTWFGHTGSVDGLAAKGGELLQLAQHVPVRLTVVTRPAPEVRQLLADIGRESPGRLEIRLATWSLAATWHALSDCDLVWIPSTERAIKAVKSANRLAESLWAGRAVVADALPSYLPFADLMPIGMPLPQAVKSMLDSHDVPARIATAQARVERDFSEDGVARLWAAAVGDACASAGSRIA